MSEHVKNDLKSILIWLSTQNQSSEALGRLGLAQLSDARNLEYLIPPALASGDYSQATPYVQRKVAQLITYFVAVQEDSDAVYVRDEQVGAVRYPVRFSLMSQMSLPKAYMAQWQDMTPEERGNLVAAQLCALNTDLYGD